MNISQSASCGYAYLGLFLRSHHTPQAILLGLEGMTCCKYTPCTILELSTGSDPETIDTGTIPSRYASIVETKHLQLGGNHSVHFNMDKDMLWRWDQVLKTHPNGMRFSVFDKDGTLLATNEYFRWVFFACARSLGLIMMDAISVLVSAVASL